MAEPYYASPGWSDLPIDLLIHVFHLLELPEALAFRGVCPLWRSASTAAAGVPMHTRKRPWLVSLATKDPLPNREKQSLRAALDPSFSSKFPHGKAVALCGASHGWLIAANELSDLVLYDPIATTTTIQLPPITGFSNCIETVYGDDERVVQGYRYLFDSGDDSIRDAVPPGSSFYDKVVLSGRPPSAGGAITLVVHTDGKRLSFAEVGGSSWRQVLGIAVDDDSFADIAHHSARFYALKMKGELVSLNFRRRHKPKREMIIAKDDNSLSVVITRYLVSTPWGHLLQIRVVLYKDQKHGFRVKIDKLDLRSHMMVGLRDPSEALRGHVAFLGQNSPVVLSTGEYPELRPDCIYFTAPRLKNDSTYRNRYNRWNGVKVFDLKKQTLEVAFPSRCDSYGRRSNPSEVWFMPSLLP